MDISGVIKSPVIVVESAPARLRIAASSGLIVKWLIILTLIGIMLYILSSIVLVLLRLWLVPKRHGVLELCEH